jgi:DnaJ-class molecular chaperone
MEPNYYVVLGVSETAAPEEIRQAYRRLAKAYHPDMSGGETTPRFLKVQRAWDTLGDGERRRAYDVRLRRERRRVEASRPSAGFKAVGPSAWEETGATLRLRLELSATEAGEGGQFSVTVPAARRCPFYGGSGLGFFLACPACDGQGLQVYGKPVPVRVPAGVASGDLLEVTLAEPAFLYRRLLIQILIMK